MKTQVIKVHPEFPDLNEIARCAKVIRSGGLVVFPTETVYGIAADFSNPAAMKRLREVKKRSDGKPFSVIISQKSLISNYTYSQDPSIYKVIDAFWPGPLTVVIPSKKEGETVGVRMPNNIIALKLTQDCPFPVAAPSANFEGHPEPKTCADALKDLDGLVEMAIDGGPTIIGHGSTVVDLTSKTPKILREGYIRKSEIEDIVKRKYILFVCTGNSCRSVMAEYLLKKELRSRDDVFISSAGTGVFIQSTASSDTLSVLRDEGIDARGHVSMPVDGIELKKSDLILVMTRTHRQQILDRVPAVEKRVYLLREFADISTASNFMMDIPDPIGRSHQEYQECLTIIKEAILKVKELV